MIYACPGKDELAFWCRLKVNVIGSSRSEPACQNKVRWSFSVSQSGHLQFGIIKIKLNVDSSTDCCDI